VLGGTAVPPGTGSRATWHGRATVLRRDFRLFIPVFASFFGGLRPGASWAAASTQLHGSLRAI